MVIIAIFSSEKFFTWACKLICFYRPHHPGMIWFAAEILILKKIIAEVCGVFLMLYEQNFPSEIKRDCDDEGCQGQSPIPALHIECLSQTLLLTGDTDTRTGPFHNYFQNFFFMTLLWLGKKQPVSISLFLQSLLGSHKANINHINDIVHH